LYIVIFVFRQQTSRRKVLNWTAACITRVQCALNFLLNQMLVYYCVSLTLTKKILLLKHGQVLKVDSSSSHVTFQQCGLPPSLFPYPLHHSP
jgi:hypothetical protein